MCGTTLRLNRQNVFRKCDTPRVCIVRREIKRNDKRNATVPSGRFSVVDRHTTSSRKDKVPSLMVIGSSVSRVTASFQLYYACRSSAGRIFRSVSTPPSYPFSCAPRRTSISNFFRLLFQYPKGSRHSTGEQTSVLVASSRTERLLLLRCNNAGSVTYTRVH